jgi:hypothetical protein
MISQGYANTRVEPFCELGQNWGNNEAARHNPAAQIWNKVAASNRAHPI